MAHRSKRIVALLLASGSLSLGVVVSAIPAEATTSPPITYVGTSGTNVPGCGSAQGAQACQTITYGLSVTPAGGTIDVGPGTYNEQVSITQNVTIIGSGPQTIIEPTSLPAFDSDTDSTQPQYYVIGVAPGVTSASVEDLDVDGSGASSQFGGCGDGFDGIYYHDASGALINVSVTDVELPESLFGCQQGQGIYVASDAGTSTPSSVSMQSVDVSAYDKNGITCDDIGTFCGISDSTVTGIGNTPLIGQNGVQAWGSSLTLLSSSISDNVYSNPYYPSYYTSASGLLVIDAGNVTVLNNQISANNVNIDAVEAPSAFGAPSATPGPWIFEANKVTNAVEGDVPFGDEVGDGIDIDSTASNVTVDANSVSGNPEFGIALFGASGTTAAFNAVQSNGDGIYIGGPGTGSAYGTDTSAATSTGNEFIDNAAYNNGTGIYVDTEAAGNTMLFNSAEGNTTSDVTDLTTGSATSGTSDTWLLSSCTTAGALTGVCSTPATPKAKLAPLKLVNHIVDAVSTWPH